MLKKCLVSALLLVAGISGMAQTATSDCKNVFSISSKENAEAEAYLSSASIEYDFAAITDPSAKISIEIVPIRDCWEAVNGTQLLPVKVIGIASSALKGSTSVKLNEITAKCFKYRVVIDRTDCRQETEWKFQSIIPARK